MKNGLFATISALIVVSSCVPAFADSTTDAIQRLEAKIDALAKENATLRTRLNRLEGTRVASIAPASRTATDVSPPRQPSKNGYAVSSPAAAAYASAAPVWSWTGCYLGAHAGYGMERDVWAGPNGGGGLAGGQLGCNYQMNMLVLGVEGEGFWSGMKSAYNFSSPGLWYHYTTKNTSDYDVALRLGIALDRALIYGKAGWVGGQFDWGYVDSAGGVISASSTLNGLLLALGLEYAIDGNWSAKFEYDYLGFAAKDVYSTFTCPAGCSNFTVSRDAQKQLFKLGLNYRFDLGKAPVASQN